MAVCCFCTLEKEDAAFSKSANRKSGVQTACPHKVAPFKET